MSHSSGVEVADIDAAEFARSVAVDDMDLLVRTLAARPAGYKAILNSPTVIRALTKSKRSRQQTNQLRRGKKLAEVSSCNLTS